MLRTIYTTIQYKPRYTEYMLYDINILMSTITIDYDMIVWVV
jgi:hypothetical protein